MSYSDLLDEEGIQANYLSVIVPRRQVTGFTLFAGSVYSLDFDYGQVVSIEQNGLALSEGSSPSLSAGEFYYDFTDEVLYVRMTDSSNPSTKFVVAFYEMYFGTADAHWYRDPLDDSTRTVYFDALINKPVDFKSTIADSLFGYIPLQTSSITLINAEHIFEKHIYDSSFNQASIRIYHVLDKITDIDIDNIALVYDGFCSDISYSADRITIKTFDRFDELTKEWRNSESSFFNQTDFPNVDPQSLGKCIRYVYGVIDGFSPVNVDFVAASAAPTTSDNRDFAVIGEQTGMADLSRTVAASPASTATRTYLNNASGFMVGDSVWLDRAVGTDEYKIVTVVDYGADFIEHTALSGGAMASGDTVKRSFVGNIFIVQNNITYQPLFNRDYTSNYSMAGGVSGFSLSTSMEANLSMAATFNPNDKIFCKVYGRTNNVTISASPFGSNDAESANLTHPVVILYDILKSRVPMSEDAINLASFQALESGNTEAIGIAIPDTKTGKFPKLKDIINQILQTGLIRQYIDNDLKWKVSRIAPLGSPTKSTDDNEILKDSFTYQFSYQEIVSDVTVEYAKAENNPNVPTSSNPRTKQTSVDSDNAKYLHKVSKQKTYQSLHFKLVDADTLAMRIQFYLSERSGNVTIKMKNRFFDSLINDTIEVTRTKLPGFEFDGETEFTNSFSITDITKGLRSVDIKMEDQLGIENNSGSW